MLKKAIPGYSNQMYLILVLGYDYLFFYYSLW